MQKFPFITADTATTADGPPSCSSRPVSETATDPHNNTSEFSPCVTLANTVWLSNFLGGNSGDFDSRVYLFNPSASAGNVTVRVSTRPLAGGLAQELTTTPLCLGSWE